MKRKTREEWYSDYMEYRRAYGLKRPCSNPIRHFLNWCKKEYTTPFLEQEMIDRWTTKQDTETYISNTNRTVALNPLIEFMRKRGEIHHLKPYSVNFNEISYEPVLFNKAELRNFFKAVDELDIPPRCNNPVQRFRSELRAVITPAMFRLMYSTGLRPNEVRWLDCEDVDLDEGVIYVRKQKGYGERIVAMHPSLVNVLKQYEPLISKLMPNRKVYFPNDNDEYRSATFITTTFKKCWYKYNPKKDRDVVSYSMRHNYAVENIMSWKHDGYKMDERALVLMKSMGHNKIESTMYYFHLVPMFADLLKEFSGETLNDVLPDL